MARRRGALRRRRRWDGAPARHRGDRVSPRGRPARRLVVSPCARVPRQCRARAPTSAGRANARRPRARWRALECRGPRFPAALFTAPTTHPDGGARARPCRVLGRPLGPDARIAEPAPARRARRDPPGTPVTPAPYGFRPPTRPGGGGGPLRPGTTPGRVLATRLPPPAGGPRP